MNSKQRCVPISAKLVAFIVGGIFIAGVIVSIISISAFYKRQLNTNMDDLTHTAKGVSNTLTDWRVSLTSSANILADHPVIIEQIHSALDNKPNTLRETIQEKGRILDVDILAVISPTGRVLAGCKLEAGTDLSQTSVVKHTLQSHEGACYYYEPICAIDFALIIAEPLYDDDTLIGIIVTGYDLVNGTLLSEIADNYNVDFTFFKDDLRISTTIKDHKTGKSLLGTTLVNQTVKKTVLHDGKVFTGRNSIGGSSFLCVYTPLISGDGHISGIVMVGENIEPVNNTRRQVITVIIIAILSIMAFMTFFAALFAKWVMARLGKITKFLREMASGEADLTKRINIDKHDEVGAMGNTFNAFCEKLQMIITEIKTSKLELGTSGSHLGSGINEMTADLAQILGNITMIHDKVDKQHISIQDTAGAVNEIAANVESLETMIESQSTSVSEASAAVEEMISNISAVNQNIENMASSFSELEQNALYGIKTQEGVDERIRQIEAQSEMLQEANAAITNIAAQTNLLAMNAAIEAAHAGDAGQGFAVVADEIRKLSETSSTQSKTIGIQLDNIKTSILDVVNASIESTKAFAAVNENIKHTTRLVSEIRAAMDEQNTGNIQISEALRLMNDGTTEVRNAAKEMTAGNAEILHNMQNLKNNATSIKTGMDEIKVGADRINQTSDALSSVSQEVEKSINKIGSQIDLFTV